MRYLLFIILLLLTVTLLNYGGRGIRRVGLSREYKRSLLALLSLVEALLYLLFAVWAVILLYKEIGSTSIVVTIILFLIIVLFGWFWLRDFIAGALFKWEMRPFEGMCVKVGDVKGDITSIGKRSLELSSKEGSFVRIPYSKLLSGALYYSEEQRGAFEHHFSITFASSKRLEELKLIVEREMGEMAWLVPSNKVESEISSMGGESYLLEVTLYPTTESAGVKSEQRLRNLVKKL